MANGYVPTEPRWAPTMAWVLPLPWPQVGTDQPAPGADLAMANLHQLPRLLPHLLDQPGLVKGGLAVGTAAVQLQQQEQQQEHDLLVSVNVS